MIMLNSLFASLLTVGLILPGPSGPRPPLFSFVTQGQGREILGREDDFVRRLSAFDRAARLKTDQPVSQTTFLDFVRENVKPWSEAETARIQSSLTRLGPHLLKLALPWPETVHLIRTTGKEEGGAAYTRGDAIILPSKVLEGMVPNELDKLLLHELFHVLSRQNPALKTALYAAIGFMPCGEIVFPTALSELRITNPDAPANEFCIRLHHAGKAIWAVPVLYASSTYRLNPGGEFFDYLQFRLLVVQTGESRPPHPDFDPANPQLLEVSEVRDFFEQVGRNTDYILHPEEILADNFALLMLDVPPPASPEILARMRQVLTATHL